MHAQQGVTTFGIQVKPVIPFGFFDPITTVEAPPLRGEVELTGGLGFGMVVRHGITRSISLETGINQITRRYDFTIANDTSGYSEGSQVRYVGYELPVLAMVYIRLGERTWMNNALGLSLDMYPSDAQRDLEEGRIYIFRNNWLQTGVVANMSVEYRTERSGYLYLGATFHRPFNDMATADLTWYDDRFVPTDMRTTLDGSYLTVDIRYFFHEPPDRTRTSGSR
ncbi:MAG: hypothetical protein JNL05_03940 [Flavobacteriales bacterium]|nr:hypothetical protein [Flavobacteriales bacterium]